MLRLALALAAIVIIGSFALASVTGEPEWCQRGGALLAAIAAFMAIFDASTEHNLRLLEEHHAQRRSLFDAEGQANLFNRIRYAQFRKEKGNLSLGKVKTVFWISIIAVVGELFHGFGDIAFRYGSDILVLLEHRVGLF